MRPQPKERLGQLLKKRHLLTGSKLVRALDQQKLHGGKLGHILVDQGSLAEDDLMIALQEHFAVPIIDWNKAPLNRAAVSLISQAEATADMILPITFVQVPSGNILVVAMEDPSRKDIIQRLNLKTGYPIKPLLAGRLRLIQAIADAYRPAPARSAAHP